MLITEILIQQHHGLFQKCLPNFLSETRTKWDYTTSHLPSIKGECRRCVLEWHDFHTTFRENRSTVCKDERGHTACLHIQYGDL